MNRFMIVLALASSVSAAFASQPDQRPELVTRGEIVAVSADEKLLTLEEFANVADEPPAPDAQPAGVRRDFVVDEETKLTASGERIELEDVAVGSFATIRYVMDFGKNVARTIEVRSRSTEQ